MNIRLNGWSILSYNFGGCFTAYKSNKFCRPKIQINQKYFSQTGVQTQRRHVYLTLSQAFCIAIFNVRRIIVNFQVLISGNLILSWANRILKRTDQKYTNESLIYTDPSLEIDSFIKLHLRFELIWIYFTSWTSYVEFTKRLIV